MKTARFVFAAAAALLPLALTACPHHEESGTTGDATVAPTPTPPPTPTMTLTPDVDAGLPPPVDAGIDAPHPTGVSNLTKCCNAIKQNAKNAPAEQQPLYQAAIAICNSGAIPPQYRNLPQCK